MLTYNCPTYDQICDMLTEVIRFVSLMHVKNIHLLPEGISVEGSIPSNRGYYIDEVHAERDCTTFHVTFDDYDESKAIISLKISILQGSRPEFDYIKFIEHQFKAFLKSIQADLLV